MEKGGFVYILGSITLKLYVGVTSDLVGRVWEHKEAVTPGFTKKYHIHRLLYYEWFETIELAIEREKELKHWKRDWKINLIKNFNSDFKDLYYEILNEDYRSSISIPAWRDRVKDDERGETEKWTPIPKGPLSDGRPLQR